MIIGLLIYLLKNINLNLIENSILIIQPELDKNELSKDTMSDINMLEKYLNKT